MDKFNVVLDDEKVKSASKNQTCPQCGRHLDPSTPQYCEECGTKPFEKRPDPK